MYGTKPAARSRGGSRGRSRGGSRGRSRGRSLGSSRRHPPVCFFWPFFPPLELSRCEPTIKEKQKKRHYVHASITLLQLHSCYVRTPNFICSTHGLCLRQKKESQLFKSTTTASQARRMTSCMVSPARKMQNVSDCLASASADIFHGEPCKKNARCFHTRIHLPHMIR